MFMRQMRLNSSIAIIALVAFVVATSSTVAHAAMLVKYTFAESTGAINNPSAAQTAPNFTAANLTATSTSKGAGITTANYNLFIGNGGQPNTALSIRGTQLSSEALAISNNRYFEFTLTPSASYTFTSLNTVVFDWARGGNDGTRGIYVYASTDGFATSTKIGQQVNSSGTAWNIGQTYNIGLTNVTTPVVFRFYARAEGSDNRDLRFDNIVINGTVALIPEPASLALLGLGGLLMLPRRRAGLSA